MNQPVDMGYLYLSTFPIVIGVLTLIYAKRPLRQTRTLLGGKPWPVKVRIRYAIFMIIAGALMTMLNLCAWLGLIKL